MLLKNMFRVRIIIITYKYIIKANKDRIWTKSTLFVFLFVLYLVRIAGSMNHLIRYNQVS